MFKKCWRDKLTFNWRFGLFLILALGIPRFVLVLQANVIGKFHFIPLVFIVMWALPFIFLSKRGRRHMGLVKVEKWNWLLYSLLIGAASSLSIYAVGLLLYEHTSQNWFVYLSKPFDKYSNVEGSTKLIIFAISALIGMSFSPIGEEFLYRGLVHASFEKSIGDRRASYIDSLAFAITHLAHFGIVYVDRQWNFFLFPSLLWMVSMFCCSQLFFYCKRQSGTLWGAISSHAGFNLVMMLIIFYSIL